jgi:ABC-type uncharacterized transport system permease subunit
MPLAVIWSLLGWLSILGYLVIAGVTLWRLWRPKKQISFSLRPLLVATIVCHFLYLAEGAVTGWLKLDTPEAVAVVLGILVAVVAFWQFQRSKMEAPLGFLLPLSAILLAFGSFERPTLLPSELRRDILLVHVALLMGGYLMLMLAFGSAVTHLLTLWSLKRKRPLALLEKLPPLEATEKLTSQLVLLGFPLLVLGMVVGVVWARMEGKSAWSDPKVLFSFLTGGVFAAYLHARFVRRWEAAALHWLVVAGFICLLVTFLAVRHTLAME